MGKKESTALEVIGSSLGFPLVGTILGGLFGGDDERGQFQRFSPDVFEAKLSPQTAEMGRMQRGIGDWMNTVGLRPTANIPWNQFADLEPAQTDIRNMLSQLATGGQGQQKAARDKVMEAATTGFAPQITNQFNQNWTENILPSILEKTGASGYNTRGSTFGGEASRTAGKAFGQQVSQQVMQNMLQGAQAIPGMIEQETQNLAGMGAVADFFRQYEQAQIDKLTQDFLMRQKPMALTDPTLMGIFAQTQPGVEGRQILQPTVAGISPPERQANPLVAAMSQAAGPDIWNFIKGFGGSGESGGGD